MMTLAYVIHALRGAEAMSILTCAMTIQALECFRTQIANLRLSHGYALKIRERRMSKRPFSPGARRRGMSRKMAAVRGAVTRTAVAAAIAGVAITGGTVPANAAPASAGLHALPAPLDDPGCDMFGWRHPMCAGGAFESPADDGIPGDNAAGGGIPAPSMLPNINGTMSPPGTPGVI
jgi:hypothetical protein